MPAISGDVVHGPFRHGMVSEGVDHVVISGNVVADVTWWAIALLSASHCVVSANRFLYLRTAEDVQGSAWAPQGPW